MRPMDDGTRERTLKNLFPGAHAAVEPWDCFPWHTDRRGLCDTWKPHSSQALAIDVFGALKVAPQVERDAVLNAIARVLQLPEGGPWQVELEWLDTSNRLKEKRRTQVDALARSPRALICVECKFTEADGGGCSQTDALRHGAHQGIVQCNGSYRHQVNRANGKASRCALTGKSIRYWEIIPRIFELRGDRDYGVCPFDGPWFQWMRNLALSYESARAEGLRPGFAIAYVDAPGLRFAERVARGELGQFAKMLRPGAVSFGVVSFQSLLAAATEALAMAGMSAARWEELGLWLSRKLERVASGGGHSD